MASLYRHYPSRQLALLLSLLLAAGLTLILTVLLHVRAGMAQQHPAPEPLPVLTTPFTPQDNYQRSVRFSGLLKAREKSSLGFEIPGVLTELTVREGDRVAAGTVLARLDTDRLAAQHRIATAELAGIEAELQLARLRAKRQRDLRASGAVSEQDFDEARLAVVALEAGRQALSERLESLAIDLANATLYAPYDGAVTARRADPGTVVAAGSPVIQLVSTGAPEARIGLPAPQLDTLQPGQRYLLELRSGAVKATLRAVGADINPHTHTALALFELPDTANALDGETVSLQLQETIAANGGWLPISALLEGERGAWTVLRLEQATGGSTVAVREAVEVLAVDGDRAYVRGSLVSGQDVIADGVHRIAAGTPVQALDREY
ncbi:efflux RND transporter periplasmic adaptor subunit [Kineobactrum sediminis]|nr:efflux RND transporter periplasmic adaptor subunit [Kineobactrum sediminis]